MCYLRKLLRALTRERKTCITEAKSKKEKGKKRSIRRRRWWWRRRRIGGGGRKKKRYVTKRGLWEGITGSRWEKRRGSTGERKRGVSRSFMERAQGGGTHYIFLSIRREGDWPFRYCELRVRQRKVLANTHTYVHAYTDTHLHPPTHPSTHTRSKNIV